MTGIVIVSHSRSLARAVASLAASMAPDENVPIAFAGGVSGADEEFGTDATDIMAAINEVDGPDGVIVFLDMGSAILSTETALDLLGEEVRSRVAISSAPIVEGAMTAAVQSSVGAPMEVIRSEAATALGPKQEQLDPESTGEPAQPEIDPTLIGKDAIKRVFSIDIPNGLHARPAARFVRAVAGIDCEVSVSNLSKVKGPVSARSLNRLSTLEVGKGDEILVSVSGPASAQAIAEIETLVAERFGERDDTPVRPGRRRPDGMVSLSPGVAIGEVWKIGTSLPVVRKYEVSGPNTEIERFTGALNRVRNRTRERIDGLGGTSVAPETEIFEAHLVLLDDPDLIDETIDLVQKEKMNVEAAWVRSINTVVERYEGLDDAYLQVRATDVKDIGIQVLIELGVDTKEFVAIPDGDSPLIVVAKELTPSRTVSLDRNRVYGIVTESAGTTSHTAILARALGIPAVGGYAAIDNLSSGSTIALDGFTGTVIHKPDLATVASFQERRDAWIREVKELKDAAARPAITLDGRRITVYANIATVDDLSSVETSGAEGIGLLRTEFLYVNRMQPPTMEEQLDYYTDIFSGVGDRPITVRTFDVGGDKNIDYLSLEAEDNPFLGVRGIRLYEHNLILFEQQLESILRIAVNRSVSIMFPMIAKVGEFEMARSAVARVHERLERDRISHKWPIDLGVMIETPASVLVAEELAQGAAFFSIGTNDLTQYVLAAERGSRQLSGFLDSFEPSVLRAVKTIVDIGARRNTTVSVCGEMGAQIEAVPLLVGLGVDKISANSASIPAVKDVIRRFDYTELERIGADIISTSRSANEVRERLRAFVER